jgi:hypothetical protein
MKRLKWPSAQAWLNFLIAAFSGLLTLVTWWQYDLGKNAQRAAVYLGLPNGQVAHSIGEAPDTLGLDFRNYGASTAEDTVIETWTLFAKNGETVEQCVPRFQGFNPPEQRIPGIQIPPGFPYSASVSFSSGNLEQLTSGQCGLIIIGRVSYFDAFGKYCQPFAIEYQKGIQGRFTISRSPRPNFCDTTKGHAMLYTSESAGSQTKPFTIQACP